MVPCDATILFYVFFITVALLIAAYVLMIFLNAIEYGVRVVIFHRTISKLHGLNTSFKTYCSIFKYFFISSVIKHNVTVCNKYGYYKNQYDWQIYDHIDEEVSPRTKQWLK